jgi:predicted RecA/RadA family phage recombinase
MAANYLQEGRYIDVTLAADATGGTPIIIGTMVGVPLVDGASGETVSCGIKGVWLLPLKSGGADPAPGDIVSFNATDGVAIGAGLAGDINNAGKVVETGAEATQTTVAVLLTPDAATLAT